MRQGAQSRSTKETTIDLQLDVDGAGNVTVTTGIPFFDHMLAQLGKHGGWDLAIDATGDLEVDTHHTIEDVGIALGAAFKQAVGEKIGVRRFASVSVPLDEALVDVSLDLSGRPFLHYDVAFDGDAMPLGTPHFEPQLAEEFWRAFATAAALTLHISLRYGRNTHHILEATFKAVARALRDAVRIEGSALPSTKGVL